MTFYAVCPGNSFKVQSSGGMRQVKSHQGGPGSGVVEPVHTSVGEPVVHITFPNACWITTSYTGTLETAQWEYLHHRNWQIL